MKVIQFMGAMVVLLLRLQAQIKQRDERDDKQRALIAARDESLALRDQSLKACTKKLADAESIVLHVADPQGQPKLKQSGAGAGAGAAAETNPAPVRTEPAPQTGDKQLAPVEVKAAQGEADWKDYVVYAVTTAAKPIYVKIVDAVRETWAKEIALHGNLITVGSKGDTIPCKDGAGAFSCKEAVTLWRGALRVKASSARWMCVVQEDKYIQPFENAAFLATVDKDTPNLVTKWGCGQHWKYHANSKGNTLPMPKGWHENIFYCEAAARQGAMCGGDGYCLNRPAAMKIIDGHASLDSFLAAYRGSVKNGAGRDFGASDMVTSCFLSSKLGSENDNSFVMKDLDHFASKTATVGVKDINCSDHNPDKKNCEHDYRLHKVDPHFIRNRIYWHMAQPDKMDVITYMKALHDKTETIALAHFIHAHPSLVAGKSVVELGCGCSAVCATVAALSGASRVVATDGDSELLPICTDNMAQNIGGAGADYRCCQLLWGDEAGESAAGAPFDVVLAADVACCVYDGALAALVKSLRSLGAAGATVLLSYQRRHRSEERFFALLRTHFQCSRVPVAQLHADFRQQQPGQSEIHIYRLIARKPTCTHAGRGVHANTVACSMWELRAWTPDDGDDVRALFAEEYADAPAIARKYARRQLARDLSDIGGRYMRDGAGQFWVAVAASTGGKVCETGGACGPRGADGTCEADGTDGADETGGAGRAAARGIIGFVGVRQHKRDVATEAAVVREPSVLEFQLCHFVEGR
eukprot:g1154.t1